MYISTLTSDGKSIVGESEDVIEEAVFQAIDNTVHFHVSFDENTDKNNNNKIGSDSDDNILLIRFAV